MNEAPVLVEITRGPIVESRHRGMIAATDGSGRMLPGLGDISFRTFLRSSAKPHQAISVIVSGAADRFEFEARHLAIIAGSHSGEEIHVTCVREILQRAGLREESLHCGTHVPFSKSAVRALGQSSPSVLQNNCSGKHAGMLAHAAFRGLSLGDYTEPGHPVQRANAATVAMFAGVSEESLSIGVDGCSAPVFGTTIEAMARCWARLVWPEGLPLEYAQAACRIVAAMQAHPEMVGGMEERIDTDIIRATGGRVLAKVGAEGVHTLGVLPSERHPSGLGIAFKIEDGLGDRARNTVAIEVLDQLGVLSAEEREALESYHHLAVRNHAGTKVGEVRPVFRLPQ